MHDGRAGESYVNQISRLFTAGTLVGVSDAELLDRFVRERDEPAFEALVGRHGPMVLGVCRSVLDDRSDAEDAFQATFLVLVRQANGLWIQGSLAGWLYRVARRTARHARKAHVARRRRERSAAEMSVRSPHEPPSHELRSVVCEEVDRLPEPYRSPVVLCLLEGLTHEEAARQLRWPVGTVSGRLSRARSLLRTRLTRRGLAPTAGAVIAGVFGTSASAAVPDPLVDATKRLALALLTNRAAVVSATTAGAWSEEVLRAMLSKALKWFAAIALAMIVTTGGVVALGQRAQRRVTRLRGDLVNDAPKHSDAPVTLHYGDGQADGKRSLGGSGEMIEFTRPDVAGLRVVGLKIHGARYGTPEPPDERFVVYFLNEDQNEILNTQMVPYSLFERGEERWVAVKFKKPVEVPTRFWVVLDFRAHQTKGVYVSYDASTGGKHSRIGLPGMRAKPIDAGDWMVEVSLSE